MEEHDKTILWGIGYTTFVAFILMLLVFLVYSGQQTYIDNSISKLSDNDRVFDTKLSGLSNFSDQEAIAIKYLNGKLNQQNLDFWVTSLNYTNRLRYKAIIPDLIFCLNTTDLAYTQYSENQFFLQYRDSKAMLVDMDMSDLQVPRCFENAKDASCLDFCKEYRDV